MAVRMPGPISTAAQLRLTVPSGRKDTVAAAEAVVGVSEVLHRQAMPLARIRPPGSSTRVPSSQRIRGPSLSRQGLSRPMLLTVALTWVAVRSPSSRALTARSAMGSMPSASESLSIIRSRQKVSSAWPKPR